MKKNAFSLIMALITVFTVTATTPIDGVKKEIKASESTVKWKGYKVTGFHEGNINLKEGFLVFDGKKLTGGEFIVDMTSIVATDLEGEYKGKLEGHLKSDDFFGVEAHPTAKLVFTSVSTLSKNNKNSYSVKGNLTIKGTTNSITLVVSVFENKVVATLKVDRAKFNIKYGSGSFFENLGDKTIYDEFDLVVDLAL